MVSLYSSWISRWEQRLAEVDRHRTPLPFDWGADWLGVDGADDPATAVIDFSRRAAASSEDFFRRRTPADFRLDRQTLRFTSPLESPHPENNTAHAEYFEAPDHRGRAAVVIPQWNADEESHIGFCQLLQRLGISSLRLSKAYHHKRRPAGLRRAEYHMSANVGRTIHAMQQSVLDARACLDWLSGRGYTRLGVTGTSLGSCVALLTVAHDGRVKAGVFNHVSLRVSDVVWTGISCRHVRQMLEPNITREQLAQAWAVISPVSYLERLGRSDLCNLLIWARFDTTFLPQYSREVLERFRTLGLPHRVASLPCGHYTTGRAPFVWLDGVKMALFLRNVL